jgi:hypothetical protein
LRRTNHSCSVQARGQHASLIEGGEELSCSGLFAAVLDEPVGVECEQRVPQPVGHIRVRPSTFELPSDEGFQQQSKGANMAASQSHRLRRAAQKASRRKAVVAEKRTAAEATNGRRQPRQIVDAVRAPVKTCVVSERLFTEGIGWLVLARTLPSGLVAGSFFLIDAWCLGVKDAFFVVITEQIFENRMDASSREQPFVDIDPSVARKLLHDAVAYAARFGLAPSKDFAEAEAIFGDIRPATETFPFGKDGKPFFVSGPNDSPTRIRRILDTLLKRAGPDNFHYIVHMGDFA